MQGNKRKQTMQHQVQDNQGNWHNVDGFQAAAFHLEGAAVRAFRTVYTYLEVKGVQVNDLNVIYKCDKLGKVKPNNLSQTITVSQYSLDFYALDTCDVWTIDGWLVTAVQNDEVTLHLRKGTERTYRVFNVDDVLHFTPNAKAMRCGY